MKRSLPAYDANTIIIDSDSDEQPTKASLKKVKTSTESFQFSNVSNPYDLIPEVPSIKLTVEHMQGDPLQLIKTLEDLYGEFGAVKLTVSDAWNCPFTFGNVDRLITVRKQILQDLTKGKAFEQKIQSYTLTNYRTNALNFSKTYKFKTNPRGKTLASKVQHEFWNLVTNPQYQNHQVEVQYAADLPSSQFGSGFPTKKLNNWKDADFQYETNLFNLNNLYRSPTSLLQIINQKKDKISGITTPWMYVGMQFATFCWHVQDLFLNSMNYNHSGSTKTWYIIPGQDKEKFDSYVKRLEENSKRKNLLQKITLIVDPLELIKEGIKVFKLNQRPRDYAVTFLKAYHCGFSHGFNICQAANFASFSSFVGIKQALKFYEKLQITQNRRLKPQVLSYEWMIYETVNQSKITPSNKDYYQKILKEYRRILNLQYILIKTVLHQCGQFADVKILKDKKRYYSNMCTYCKNYLYLTSLQCVTCHQNLCERHLNQCLCPKKKWILIIRTLNPDRLKLQEVVPLIHDRELQLEQ